MPLQTVPGGRYLGQNLAQLEARLAALQEQADSSATNLTSASVNGQSFTFGQRADGGSSVGDILELQEALAFLAPHKYCAPPSSRTAIRLG